MREDDVFREKNHIRHEMEARRRSLECEWIEANSSVIIDRLKARPELQAAQTIHCYVSWRNEVQTHRLIESLLSEERRVVVPVVDLGSRRLVHSQVYRFQDLASGAFGILEPPEEKRVPVPISDLDLIIVPGVAFDRAGNRLGFGGGYYDGFLKDTCAAKAGLCFSFQLLETLPTRPLDERVDLLITELATHEF